MVQRGSRSYIMVHGEQSVRRALEDRVLGPSNPRADSLGSVAGEFADE